MRAKQRQPIWDEVEVGFELPSLTKIATTKMLIQWAGATCDFNPHHYDDQSPMASATKGIIVQGALKRQWLVQLMTDWIGDAGWIENFSCQYFGVDFPRHMRTMNEPFDEGETWFCKGVVTSKFMRNDRHLVEFDIWIENSRGDKTTRGKAIVALPCGPKNHRDGKMPFCTPR